MVGTIKWKVEWANDTGPNDESYWEWWIITDGEKAFKAESDQEAYWLRDLLNKPKDYQ